MSRNLHFKMQTSLENVGFKSFANSTTGKTKKASQAQEKYDILNSFVFTLKFPSYNRTSENLVNTSTCLAYSENQKLMLSPESIAC